MKEIFKSKKRWMALVVLLLAGMFIGLYSQSQSHRTVHSYHLTTPLKEINQAKIDRVLQPYLGASFWEMDLERIQADLKRLDWVNHAVVKRSWPDQVIISLQEQIAVARWGEDGLVNQQGEVFFPNSIDGYENLVRLDGPIEHSESLLKKLSDFQSSLSALGWSVSRLVESVDGVWEIEVLEGAKIILDRQNEGYKLERFLRAYPELKTPFRKSAQVYDLRYSNGFSIQLKNDRSAQ